MPTTEKQGRRHSSEVTVVALTGQPTTRPARIDPADVREEFIRTSGKGGQNRNKVASCVRLTHLPTGIQVVADNQRTQGQNRKDAWARLETILTDREAVSAHEQVNQDRASVFGESRTFTWTGWRDEVKGPNGRRARMGRALAGKLDPLLR